MREELRAPRRRLEHQVAVLADGEPAERVAVEIELGDLGDRAAPQLLVRRALRDPEEELAVGARRGALACRPERRPAHCLSERRAVDGRRRTDVQAHGDVGHELRLAPRDRLGREPCRRAVVDRAEGDAVVVDLRDRVPQREDLEAARVREDRPVPGHEPVEPAELRDEVLPRPEVQVVRVAEEDGRAERAELVRVDSLHRSLRPDGHERRRLDVAVRRVDDTRARGAVGRLEGERAQLIGSGARRG